MAKLIHVQLVEIPGVAGRVIADLYACDPTMLQVAWEGGGVTVIEASRVERVTFDPVRCAWVSEQRHVQPSASLCRR